MPSTNFVSSPIPSTRNTAATRARSSTSSPNPEPIRFTATSTNSSAIKSSTPKASSIPSFPITSKISLAPLSAAPSKKTKPSSSAPMKAIASKRHFLGPGLPSHRGRSGRRLLGAGRQRHNRDLHGYSDRPDRRGSPQCPPGMLGGGSDGGRLPHPSGHRLLRHLPQRQNPGRML